MRSTRLAVLDLEGYDLDPELALVDATTPTSEYDAFAFGSWTSYVLANATGEQDDTAFRPHAQQLRVTELGARMPEVLRLVREHFDTAGLQWVRIFGLQDGVLAPHVDFLEFEKPGVRLQLPLRTDPDALHSEQDTVFHLRRGEVWSIHATVPHSAVSGPGPARLSLCLDFADTGTDPAAGIRGTVRPSRDVHVLDRPPATAADLAGLADGLPSGRLSADDRTTLFRRCAALHYRRASAAGDVYDWFAATADRLGDATLAADAEAFRVYCLEKRAYQESFAWSA